LFQAEDMLRNLQSDLASGVLKTVSPDSHDVLRITETLSAKHAEMSGNRPSFRGGGFSQL
jgi:hypothetical protein